MNERIKELAVECTFFTYGVNGELLYDGFNEEKFAELIVSECVMLCDKVYEQNDNVKIQAGATFCREDIKQHFGVEE